MAQGSGNGEGAQSRTAQLLELWTALEALSPQTLRRPEELLTTSRSQIVPVDETGFVWNRELRPQVDKRIFHHVVMGEIPLETPFRALAQKYADDGVELPAARPNALLAVVVCDARGVPNLDMISISSFAWALPLALRGDLRALANWPGEERRLLEGLRARLGSEDGEGDPQPLTWQTLMDALHWLVRALGIEATWVRAPSYFLREYVFQWNREPVESVLLNSFFLNALLRARSLEEKSQLPAVLRRYLDSSAPVPKQRRDILQDTSVFCDLLAPSHTPLGRWPSPGRHPLVALQQAAVNAAVSSGPGEITAVNGPPGTGKTTLLRDIVAAVITQRAEVLMTFDAPADAFKRTGVILKRANAKFELREISPKLHGFELLVASSNNKAVENVSAELPSLEALAEDLPKLRYFSSIASSLRQGPCWGLIAAVLGNAANLRHFFDTFWNDEDRGLESYLATAAGTARRVVDPAGNSRVPFVVQAENPPSGLPDALRRWEVARQRFSSVLQACRQMRDRLQDVHLQEARKAKALAVLARSETDRAALQAECRELQPIVAQLRSALTAAEETQKACNEALERHQKTRGGAPDQQWRTQESALRSQLAESRGRVREAQERFTEDSQKLEQLLERRKLFEASLDDERRALLEADRVLAEAVLSAPMASAVSRLPHDEKHQSTPWLGAREQRLRDEVFVAAVELHKAFIDAAAEPIRHNLAAFRHNLWRPISNANSDHVRDLWATFALVVPVFSTTFASVEKMFRTLGSHSLGWLLLDEAGQASPQAAVGALARARRVVVVGDPMQVEPVVTLPEPFIAHLCKQFSVSMSEDAAPSASVQTFADRAALLGSAFETREGTRTVGMPLLVHRRCAEPMFQIANAVAYENLMVKGTPPRSSPIGAVLRDSCWYHVSGTASGHWCPEEGEVLVRMLRRLRESGTAADIYVISPFRSVADQARSLLRLTPDLYAFPRERVGTIHTVQGREADAVILLLGAPDPTQEGARRWAGARPNLLNVAVTRAKERLYVVGNYDLWSSAGNFRLLAQRIPRKNLDPKGLRAPIAAPLSA